MIRDRFERARPGKAFQSHIVRDQGQVWEVRCECCLDTPIRLMVPADDFRGKMRVGGKDVVVERLVLACLPAYKEALVSMSDGSRHVFPVCDECSHGLEARELEAMYAQELRHLDEMGVALDDFWLDRHPVAVLKVAPVIQE